MNFTRHYFSIALLCISTCATAQISISDLSLTYSEFFNTLPQNPSSQEDPWSDNGTLPNWSAENETVETLNIRYGSSRSTGGSSVRGLYSYGDRSIPEMALGVITTNSSGAITFGTKYHNQSGEAIQSVTVSYTGEQWRISNGQRPQVLGFSYLVSNSDPSIAMPERTSGYVYVPELYLISPKFDTTGLVFAGETGIPLDGNLPENQVQISFTFNVTLANGDYLFFRWYKENSSKLEFGLAVDDLSVDFSNSAVNELSFTSNAPMYHYINGPIDLRIPDEGDPEPYDPPSTVESGVMNPEETIWRTLIQDILAEDYAQVRLDAPTVGYDLVAFTDATNSNRQHYVLRHNGEVDNPHHWGTYIFNTSPSYINEYLSIPHPVHDRFTARQGGYLYQELDVAGIQIAGNYRCSSSTASGCHGSTSVCPGITDFRESDAAHATEMPFQYATEEIANANINSNFIQLHGFTFDPDEMVDLINPSVIVSNGTDQDPSGGDRVIDFVSHIDNNSLYNAVGVHSDNYDFKLTGYTNTVGRFLNVHHADICSSVQISNNITDRFMHVEQRGELREIESNYSIIQGAIENTVGSPLPLQLLSFNYQCEPASCFLEWKTINSSNVEYIEILGSKKGKEYHSLGKKQAVNQEELVYYAFPILHSNHSYFKLRIVDFDGMTEYSHVLHLSQNAPDIQVYPNSFDTYLTINAPEGSEYRIYDALGQVMLSGQTSRGKQLYEAAHLKKGIYILKITYQEKAHNFRLVKH